MDPITTQDADDLLVARRLVKITVDGVDKEVHPGKYVVSAFKEKIGVPAEYELDIVIRGELHPLDDNAEIRVVAHEVFVSHVRHGGSS